MIEIIQKKCLYTQLAKLYNDFFYLIVLAANSIAYQNRKRCILQNVKEIFTINVQFCYILTGWERLIYNNKVLEDALFNKNFIISEKKFCLADARYHNTNYLLYPYYGIRYYLKK